jgi:hypothetical protein
MTTVAEAIGAAQLAKEQAEAERAAAFARALSQSMATPEDTLNPAIAERINADEDFRRIANREVYIGGVPDLQMSPAICFTPMTVSGKTVYSMQVFVP